MLRAAEVEDAPEPQGDGDCYAVAGRAAIDNAYPDLRVVHATVESKTVPRHGHAWIEYEDPQWGRLVRDMSNGNDVTLPWDFYYELGRVQDVARYTRQEALTNMVSSGHFGPWHDDGVSR